MVNNVIYTLCTQSCNSWKSPNNSSQLYIYSIQIIPYPFHVFVINQLQLTSWREWHVKAPPRIALAVIISLFVSIDTLAHSIRVYTPTQEEDMAVFTVNWALIENALHSSNFVVIIFILSFVWSPSRPVTIWLRVYVLYIEVNRRIVSKNRYTPRHIIYIP